MYEAALLKERVDKLTDLLREARPLLMLHNHRLSDLTDDELHALVVTVRRIDAALRDHEPDPD